jgi:arginase
MADGRRDLVVLGIPIDSEGLAEGCNLTPRVLRQTGLIATLGADDAGDLPLAITDTRRDPVTGVLAYRQMREATQTIRRGLLPLLDGSRFVVAVGGCCSLLIGVFGALRDKFGRTGLAFLDGHLDFYSGTTTPSGCAADFELWALTGFGPPGLSDVGGSPPMLQPRDAWVLGYRDYQDSLSFNSPDPYKLIPQAHFVDYETVLQRGASAVGGEAALALAFDPGRFWVHLDLDVLSSRAMPAVDYWEPGGFDWDQLRQLLAPLVASPACIGLDVTIYNPSLDPRRKHAAKIVELLRDVLAT